MEVLALDGDCAGFPFGYGSDNGLHGLGFFDLMRILKDPAFDAGLAAEMPWHDFGAGLGIRNALRFGRPNRFTLNAALHSDFAPLRSVANICIMRNFECSGNPIAETLLELASSSSRRSIEQRRFARHAEAIFPGAGKEDIGFQK